MKIQMPIVGGIQWSERLKCRDTPSIGPAQILSL